MCDGSDQGGEIGLLGGLVNDRIVRVRRMSYVSSPEVEYPDGAIEITAEHFGSVLFDVAGNGDDLRRLAGPWRDPFEPSLSAINEEYVRTHGKWTAFDLSDEPPWSSLVGATIRSVVSLSSPISGRPPRGASIVTDHAVLRVEVEADELFAAAHPR